MTATLNRRAALLTAAFGVTALLAACSASSTLPAGLTARMDQPGASLDRAEAVALINQFRASRNAGPVTLDADLNARAAELASRYANTGTAPARPDDVSGMRLSAGYATFADTFSGWRGVRGDADAIANASASRVGIASAYQANSQYGVHWVLLLDGGSGAMAASTMTAPARQ